MLRGLVQVILVLAVLLLSASVGVAGESDCQRGRELFAAEDYAAAIQEFSAVIARQSKEAVTAQFGIAASYWAWQKPTEACDAYEKCLAMAMEKGEVSVIKDMVAAASWRFLDQKQPREALRLYEKLLTAAPDDVAVSYWLVFVADCHWLLGNRAEADAYYEKAIAACEASGDGAIMKVNKRNIAWRYMEHGQPRKGLRMHQELLASAVDDDDRRDAIFWVGRAYRDCGEIDKATVVLTDLVERYPEGDASTNGYITLAECLFMKGKPSEGWAWLDKLVAANPSARPLALVNKAELVLVHSGDAETAISLLNQVISEYPESSESAIAKTWLVSALIEAGRVNEAVSLIREVLSKNPDASVDEKARYLNQIADIYFRANRYGEAVEAFKDVLRLEDVPEAMQAKARYHLGLCSDKLGDRSLAVDYMNEVISRYGNTDWAKKARGMLYLWGQLKTSETTTGGD